MPTDATKRAQDIEILAELLGVEVDEVKEDGDELSVTYHDDDGPSVTIDPDRYIQLSQGSFMLRADADGDTRDIVRRSLAALAAFQVAP